MKKLTLMLLSLLLFVGSLPVLGAENPIFYLNRGFDDEVTYSAPQDAEIKGKNYIAKIVADGRDKSLLIKNRESGVKVSYSFTPEQDDFYIDVKVKTSNFASAKNVLSIVGKSSVTNAVNFNENGTVTNADGTVIAKYSAGKWYEITVFCDTESGKYDVYIDGRIRASRCLLKDAKILGFSSECAASPEETELLYDYIRAFAASSPSAAKNTDYVYNFEASEDVSLDLAEVTHEESRLALSRDFEDDTAGITPDGFWHKGDNVTVFEDDKNGKYLKLLRNDGKGSELYADWLTNMSLDSMMVEFDFTMPKNNAASKLFTLRDRAGNFATLLNTYTDNTVKTSSGITVAKRINKKKTNIAVYLDFEERTYTVYTNRELAVENIPIPNAKTEDYIQLIRFELSAGADSEMNIDNLFIYSGNEPQPFSENAAKEREEAKANENKSEDISGPPVELKPDMQYFQKINEDISESPSSYFGTYDDVKKLYAESLCIVARNSKVMLLGQKYDTASKVLYEDMIMYAPVRMLAAAYGYNVSWNANDGSIELGNSIKLTGGSADIIKNGEKITLDKPVLIRDGISYVEIKSFANRVLNNYVYQSEYAIAVISKQKLSYQTVTSALNYIVYERPNAKTLYKKLLEKYPSNEHPRALFGKDEFEAAKRNTEKYEELRLWSDKIIKTADGIVDSALPKMAYDSAGLRVQNLTSTEQVLDLYWAYYYTGDEKYFESAKERAYACAAYPTWGAEQHFLEVSSTSSALGLIYDLFYDKLTPEDKDVIAEAIINFAIKPAIEHYYGRGASNWPVRNTNWNIVCNAGIILGAAAIMDEYEGTLCADAVEKALKSIEYMMTSYAPEGAWVEGPAYWDYTVSYNISAICTLFKAFGSDFGISDVPGFLETGYYPFRMSGNAGMYAYHDAPRVLVMSGSAEVFKIAKLANDPSLSALQKQTMNKNGTLGTIRSLIWYDPDFVTDAKEQPKDNLYTSAQVATLRSDWGSNAVWLGIHAGKNDVGHGHVDLGSFEYEANGVRFANEMGKDDYNLPGYFDVVNRNLYVTRAEGHNVYVINPDSGAGQEIRAGSVIEKVQSKPRGCIYKIDMTPAYVKQVSSAERGFMLSHERRVFTVQDEIVPKGNDEYYWFWHTVADIEINPDGKSVTLTNSGRKCTLYFECSTDFKIEKGYSLPLPTSPKVDAQLGGLKSFINKITVRFKSEVSKPLTFRAVAMAEGCDYAPDSVLTPIKDWNIEDGESAVTYSKPSSIMLDGEELTDYSADKTEYTVPLYKVPEKMPEISVLGVSEYEISQATLENPIAKIKVKSEKSKDFYLTYYINFAITPSAQKPEGAKLNIKEITASATPEAENPAQNAMDGNLDTRWAAEGEQSLLCDLGEVKEISGVGLAIYYGMQRRQNFEITLSEDGENFVSIVHGKTSGTTLDKEYLSIPIQKARYIKLNFSGNSANAWNSITELEIWGR